MEHEGRLMKEIDLKNGKKRRKSCLARPRAVELSKWAEDHCLPTTSVLYIYSDEKTARENSKNRILPMIPSRRY